MPKMSSIESSGREGGKGLEGERRDILGGGERGGKGRGKREERGKKVRPTHILIVTRFSIFRQTFLFLFLQ